MAEESLRNKTVKGVGWSAIDNISQHGVTFIVGIVLARLLSPDDYGLVGIIGIFTSVCSILIYAGFGNALIRKNNATDDDYNTVFIINIIMSIALYVIIFFCSPIIADFFSRQELIVLTRISALGLIIGAFALVQQTILTKRIDFRTLTKISIFATVISGVIGIGLAFLDYGVWALVIMGLIGSIIRTSLLWAYNRWVPTLLFSKKSFLELFGFGWKIIIVGFVDTVWKQLYQVVVGKFYNPATLGQYSRANGYSELLSTNLTSIVQRVTYPLLSNIQDNNERMVLAYRKIIRTTCFICAISMFGLGAISESLIYCMIGPNWHEASIYLPLICVSASTYPIHALNVNMLEVKGRSDLLLGLEIVKKGILVAPLLIGAFVGIMPMLYANLLVTIICFFLNSYFPGKLIGYGSWMQIRDVAPSYGIALFVALPVFFLNFLPLSYWIILPIQCITGLILFIVVYKFVKIQEFDDILDMLKPLWKKIRN